MDSYDVWHGGPKRRRSVGEVSDVRPGGAQVARRRVLQPGVIALCSPPADPQITKWDPRDRVRESVQGTSLRADAEQREIATVPFRQGMGEARNVNADPGGLRTHRRHVQSDA
jgi:hypothetical protein